MAKSEKICIHCGDVCRDDTVVRDDKYFCCSGCLFVYEILHDTDTQKDYDISKLKYIKPKALTPGEYDFLNTADIKEKIIQYSINGRTRVIFRLPNIYCSACVWLLENIGRMDSGIIESKVNFLKKEISILYMEELTDLRQIASLLASIGYKPQLNFADLGSEKKEKSDKSLLIKVGVAGFCFANIMLFALPEYLAKGMLEPDIKTYLRFLSLIASLPVLYAASDYFRSAWMSFKVRILSIDVPLSLGILALFLRSFYEVVTMTGSGYSDSLSGLVFFLLLGKVFQKKTFYQLSFERDYKSYFPLSVIKKKGSKEEFIPLNDVKSGDILLIRNSEIIPADSMLLGSETLLDYSFLTGESTPTFVKTGDKIFSGAKNIGTGVEVKVVRDFQQSYMTEIWGSQNVKKKELTGNSLISNKMAKYFTVFVLIVSFAGFLWWLPKDINIAMNVFVSILIVACPCALALSTPFSYGTALRIFSKYNFFLKSDNVVEELTRIDEIIFDKTGTLTEAENSVLSYQGRKLTQLEKDIVRSVARNSTHPYSRLIFTELETSDDKLLIEKYSEIFGQGIEAKLGETIFRLGKKSFVSKEEESDFLSDISGESAVHIAFNGVYTGFFSIKSDYRTGIFDSLNKLSDEYRITILSGDSEKEKPFLEKHLKEGFNYNFNQSPADKLYYIQNIQNENKRVLMAGDGLNDSGALLQSDVGIAVSDNTANFTPGSDAILLADKLTMLPDFISLAKKSVETAYFSYGLSILYNLIGFGFAFTGNLSPVVAAILMPISSISVVLFAVLRVTLFGQKLKVKEISFI